MERSLKVTEQNSQGLNERSLNKETIVAIHGLTGNHKTFYHYRKSLSYTYNFISYDLRGRGDSAPSPSDTSIFNHAEELENFLKENEIKRPILIGYSMGAYICALVASRMPEVSKLVLLDGAGKVGELQKQLIVPSLKRLSLTFNTEEAYIEYTKGVYKTIGVEWNEAVGQVTRHEVGKFGDQWKNKADEALIKKDFESFYEFKAEDVFPKITCPTLLVIANGTLGNNPSLFTKESYEEVIEKTEDLQVVEVPANHYTLTFENQKTLNEVIIDFLNSH